METCFECGMSTDATRHGNPLCYVCQRVADGLPRRYAVIPGLLQAWNAYHADTIAALQAENERLRATLEKIRNLDEPYILDGPEYADIASEALWPLGGVRDRTEGEGCEQWTPSHPSRDDGQVALDCQECGMHPAVVCYDCAERERREDDAT